MPNPDGPNLKGFLREIHRLDAEARLHRAEARIAALERRLAEQALTDPLTGLPNRTRFTDRLGLALRQAQRRGGCVGLLHLDLDRFKRINELLGPGGGDEILRQVAHRLESALRLGDTLARMGGDRFMVLLPDPKDALGAMRTARKLLEALDAPFQIGGRELRLTASIGACVYPQDGLDEGSLQVHAESAVSRAKERGGNRIECFTSTLDQNALERQELEQSLHDALANGELQVYFQPQFFMDGRLGGAEALLRWNHPLLGPVPPTKFIPLAEENRLILPIGAWALREACRRMAAWQALVPDPLVLAVNVSALQFGCGDWDTCVVEALRDSGLPAGQLELELTESVVMRQGQEDIRPLHRLREIGTRIAIDDFGTGYSSLGYLQRLPITTLKLDQSFVSTLQAEPPEPSSEHIVRAVIQLAHSLGLLVVAEGVETEGQRDMLELLGCDCLQGFLLGRPLPADGFEALLQSVAARGFLASPRDAAPVPVRTRRRG